ncbi:hypothetical protein JTE90_006189 [Oedothorax gibbosus]|uniref:Zinc transporter ZIP4/12 EF-hand domain-containing protein n=1 Tax=Oedothorax gibbosus TaxID=931172 RepID=A0AAV6VTB3_9ARAC|nr:hypothetical protein JTE90_006189 [Oedothorax gibbosus]
MRTLAEPGHVVSQFGGNCNLTGGLLPFCEFASFDFRNMAASLAAPRGLLIFVLTCCIFAGVRGNLMRLFSANPPAFVNVSDLKSSLRTLVDNVGSRLRCEEHGLKHVECVKCLDTEKLITILKLDTSSKSFSRQNAEDLSVLLVHQILYFESMCISLSEGCSDIDECQTEVLDVMGRYANPSESLVKVLRIFKLYLKEDTDKECFSAQEILEELQPSNFPTNEVRGIRQAFVIMMGRIFEGRCIGIGESVTDFLDDIFHHYGDSCSPYMSIGGLKRLIHDLQSGQGSDHDHDHHHSHHHDHEHDHDCNHKHAHFAHYHDGHFHSPPSYLSHNSSHGHTDHHHDHSSHGHDHFNHDHSDKDHDYFHHDHSSHEASHDHSGHDHDHSAHGHDHSGHDHHSHEFNHSTHDPSEHHSEFEQNHTHSEMGNVQLSGIPPAMSSSLKYDAITKAEGSDVNIFDIISSTLPSPTIISEKNVSTPANTQASTLNTKLDLPTSTVSSTNTYPSNSSSELLFVDGNKNVERFRRATSEQDKFSGPFASLRSDLSHPEEEEKIEEPIPTDDVKKVYLLQNDHNRNSNLEMSGTPHQFASLAAKCLSVEELIAKFGLRENDTLTKSDFIDLCPALVQQVVSGVCTDTALPPAILPSRFEVYGYGSLSVFIITLTSLAGVLLLPIMTKMAYNYIIAGFYGLAFSTLAADAMLHLMPQFLGLHSHGSGDSDHGHSHDSGFLEPYAQLQLGVFFTIYALFLFEAIMGAVSGGDAHSHSQESKGHGHSHGTFPDELPTLISVKTKSEVQLTVSRDQSSTSLDTEIVEVEPMKKPPNLMVAKPVFLGLTSMAIVVTLGDSMHNFGDGLAIGAAFSTGVRGGLSTAIAVFCHEVPHEFGDFVVLLSTGLSFSKALWINFLSGLTCFAGLYIGILIGDNEVARKWVMAVTAGIFLYVALGEMLPELREHTKGSRVTMLIVKNLGILAGLGIMLLISVYEDQIA